MVVELLVGGQVVVERLVGDQAIGLGLQRLENWEV